MSLLVVSVSHKTAPMGVLTRLSMPPDEVEALSLRLLDSPDIGEALVLSTCNRTEVYVETARFHGGLAAIATELAARAEVAREDLRGLCSVFYESAAVTHCFGVTAGLDSLVVGENQVLGQVRAALTAAQRAGTVGQELNVLFQHALRLGKRVQTQTAIGLAGRSVVTAAYERLAEAGIGLHDRTVLVVGAGAMGGLAAPTAPAAGAHVVSVNRTLERAERLAAGVEGEAAPMARLRESLQGADVAITCTGMRGHLLSRANLEAAPRVRAVVDLAMPADVDPAVADQVHLVSLATLAADQRLGDNEADIAAARTLVDEAAAEFASSRRATAVAPTVVALRAMAHDIVDLEMVRLETRLPQLSERERHEVHRSLQRLAEKFLHRPTVRVQQFAAEEHQVDYAAALRELFALDPSRPEDAFR